MASNGLNMTENEVRKSLKMLEQSIAMFEKTKSETEREMRNKINENGDKEYSPEDISDQIKLIQAAEDEQIAKYEMFGGNAKEFLASLQNSKTLKGKLGGLFNKLMTKSEPIKQEKDVVKEVKVKPVRAEIQSKAIQTELEQLPNNSQVKVGETFDVIPLPSNGECYRTQGGKKPSKIAVSYLTAYDENMIVSPNLYRDKLILDYLLNAKIKDFPISPDDMVEGDREAVILFLRANGYGTDYPVTATDNKSGQDFNTVIDLSKLKFKEFNLTGDENGYFDFTLPVSGAKVKFKFLTHRENIELKRLNEIEMRALAKPRIASFVSDLDFYIENDEKVTKEQRSLVKKAIREIEKWESEMPEDEAELISHDLTNKLKMSVVSINGNTDRYYVEDYIDNMAVKDSLALRGYITDNEPGINYNITVERPESLGGGSITVFLRLNEYLFLNVTR